MVLDRNRSRTAARFAPVIASSANARRALAWRRRPSPCAALHIQGKWSRYGGPCLLAVWLTIALPVKAGAETATVAPDAVAPTSFPVTPYSPFATEASRRFAIPELLIRAVIEVESAGNAHADHARELS